MREVPQAIMEMMNRYGNEFKEIFDAEINWFAGKLCLLGIPDFDIVEFGEFMQKLGYREKNDGSLADYIELKYGKRGRALIDELISL